MKFNLLQKTNKNLDNNEINITMEVAEKNKEIDGFIDYINNYNEYSKKVVVNKDYEILEIDYKDIVLFYSDKQYNYCRTKDCDYKTKKKLYELEKTDANFIRISKSCIVNILHVEKFDISENGKIIVKLDTGTVEIVSRRKMRYVLNYLDERSI